MQTLLNNIFGVHKFSHKSFCCWYNNTWIISFLWKINVQEDFDFMIKCSNYKTFRPKSVIAHKLCIYTTLHCDFYNLEICTFAKCNICLFLWLKYFVCLDF